MLAKIKLWGIAALGILSAILYGLLRVKSSELEVAEEKNKTLEENEALSAKMEKAEDIILNELWSKEEEVEDEYNSKFKQAKDVPSRPLSDASLRLLNDSNEEGSD
jgi:hypothetical protein